MPKRRGGRWRHLISKEIIFTVQFLLRFAGRLRITSARLLFSPRPDDIYIASYPRSGTTVVQLVLHQLVTKGGDLTFDHISEVIPFLERAIHMGRDFESLPSPRVFKTHLPYGELSRWPGKYIYVVRDGRDVLVSYFHFHNTHLRVRGAAKRKLSEFCDLFLSGRIAGGSWFKHVSEWLSRSDHDNVLVVKYEELISDLPREVRRIAAFCDIDVDTATCARICRHCSFDFMKEREAQFDHINEILWERRFQESAFIRRGRTGSWKDELSGAQSIAFDTIAQRWFTKLGYGIESARGSSLPGDSRPQLDVQS